jgi:hypothetical protein
MHHLCPFWFRTGHYGNCYLPLGRARAFDRNIWQCMRRRLHNPGPRSIALKHRQCPFPQYPSPFIPCIAQLSHVIPVLDIQQLSYDYDLGYGCDVKLENGSKRNVQSHEMTVMFFFLEESETKTKRFIRCMVRGYVLESRRKRQREGISTCSGMINGLPVAVLRPLA